MDEKMRISIPMDYEFETVEDAIEALGGEKVLLEVVKRYFDYASANKKYRLDRQEKEKALKGELKAAGVTVAELLTRLKEKGL